MLSSADQKSVIDAMESQLGDYFEAGDGYWGDDWLTTGYANGGGRSCNVDTRAAAAWLTGGANATHRSLIRDG